MKINIICINYNYAHFIQQNIELWDLAKAQANSLCIVDDRSSNTNKDFDYVKNHFQEQFIQTAGEKSCFNGINQLRAIQLGIQTVGLREDEYYWFIDADDVPVQNAIQDINEAISTNLNGELYAFSRIDEALGNITTTPEKRHFMWVTDAPTSSLVAKGSLLKRCWSGLFSDAVYRDVWFDIRLACNAQNSKIKVMSVVSHVKKAHADNDSLRYKNSVFKRYARILRTVLYYITCCR